MKGRNILISLIVSLVMMLGLPLMSQRLRAEAQTQISFSYFHEALSPYGSWENTSNYGPVWRPRGMATGWQPYYNDGHWVYTDYGWTWVSDRPWGDVAFHYGTWYSDNNGWVWVPGYNWGPAWVTWRSTDRNIGWAPLPPTFSFNLSFGRNNSYYDDFPSDYNYAGQPVVVNNSYYVFVPAQNMMTTNLTVVRMQSDNFEMFRTSRPYTTFTVVSNHIANPGPRMAEFDSFRHNRQRMNQMMHESRLMPRPIRGEFRRQRIDVASPTITRREARGVLGREYTNRPQNQPMKDVREQRRLERQQQPQQEQRRLERQQQQQQQQQQKRLERQQQQPQQQEQRRLERQQQQQQQQQKRLERQQQQQQKRLERQQQQQQQQQQKRLERQQQQPPQQQRRQERQQQQQQKQQRHLGRQQQQQPPQEQKQQLETKL